MKDIISDGEVERMKEEREVKRQARDMQEWMNEYMKLEELWWMKRRQKKKEEEGNWVIRRLKQIHERSEKKGKREMQEWNNDVKEEDWKKKKKAKTKREQRLKETVCDAEVEGDERRKKWNRWKKGCKNEIMTEWRKKND